MGKNERFSFPFFVVFFWKRGMIRTRAMVVCPFLLFIVAHSDIHSATDPIYSLPLCLSFTNRTKRKRKKTVQSWGGEPSPSKYGPFTFCHHKSLSNMMKTCFREPFTLHYPNLYRSCLAIKSIQNRRKTVETVSEEMQLKLQRLNFTGKMSRWITLPVIHQEFSPRLGNPWIHY